MQPHPEAPVNDHVAVAGTDSAGSSTAQKDVTKLRIGAELDAIQWVLEYHIKC